MKDYKMSVEMSAGLDDSNRLIFEHGLTSSVDGITRELTRKMIDFEDMAVRAALLKLGWTPPKKDGNNDTPQ